MPGGPIIAGAIIVTSIWAFVEGMHWLERHCDRMIDDYHDANDEDVRADALVPGFAAERASYRGNCRCRHCQTRGLREPCSDFDGD